MPHAGWGTISLYKTNSSGAYILESHTTTGSSLPLLKKFAPHRAHKNKKMYGEHCKNENKNSIW